jgi:lysyl-tRNA synthetase class I
MKMPIMMGLGTDQAGSGLGDLLSGLKSPDSAKLEGISDMAQGVASVASGIIGGRARRREQRQANREYQMMRERYMQQDIGNVYADLQNPYEDLTVNQQASEFAKQQRQQASANIMQGLQGSAGGSGIAALAQSLAQQEAQAAQMASADIASQEARNQALAAQGAMRLQSLERSGAESALLREQERTETLFGMAQQRKARADLAREQATQAIVGGVAQAGGGVAKTLFGT